MDSKPDDFPVNYTKEAFTHPINLGTLLLATIIGFVAGSFDVPTSLVLSMVCATELMYLGIVPRLPRFRRITKLRKMSESESQSNDKELFRNLNESDKRQYLVLRHLVKLAKDNFKKMPYGSQGLLENMRGKMEELLSDYLVLMDRYKRYELYHNTSHEERLKKEVAQLEAEIGELASTQLKKTKARRVRILKKRLQKFSIAKEKYLVCETHLETIEDALRFIYEQSMTMSNAEEIGTQLYNMLEEMEETTALINNLEREPFSYEPNADETALDAELARAEMQHHTTKKQRVKE